MQSKVVLKQDIVSFVLWARGIEQVLVFLWYFWCFLGIFGVFLGFLVVSKKVDFLEKACHF